MRSGGPTRQIYIEDIYANRPAVGPLGDEFYATDIGVLFKSNGTAWTVISDPWGFKFFEDEGHLTSGMAIEKAGLTTIPAEDDTFLTANHSWTILDSVGKLAANAGGAGDDVVSWDLGGARERILFIVGMTHMGDVGNAVSIGAQVGALGGVDVDDAYYAMIRHDSAQIFEENAGFASIASEPSWKDLEAGQAITVVRTGIMWGKAFFFDGATGTIKLFVRQGNTWYEVVSVVDASFPTLSTLVMRAAPQAANEELHIGVPFLCFAAAP